MTGHILTCIAGLSFIMSGNSPLDVATVILVPRARIRQSHRQKTGNAAMNE